MARRPAQPKAPPAEADPDAIDDTLHPRRTQFLTGHDDALRIVSRAVRGGRPPSGWMFSGPPGIGKATLAYRIARYLLSYGATADGAEDLSVPEDGRDAALLSAGAHPGLLVLKRGINPRTGKPMSVLAVDEVRRLGAFFGMTSGAGGWRIALIDTADDMNDAAANALLKLLEEPPERALLMVLANAPGRMLPTIRSRCQKIALRPLADAAMAEVLTRQKPDLPPQTRSELIRLAAGSPGAALRLTQGDGLMLAEAADKLIEQSAVPDIPAIFALADKIARIDDGTAQFGDFLVQALERRIRRRALDGHAGTDRWNGVLERAHTLFGRTAALHLDPRQTLLSAAAEMQRAAARAGGV